MAQPAIETRSLCKNYRVSRGLFRRGPAKTAVCEVDLQVEQGELFVMLGRNGAGKTTLVKLLTTLVLPSSGEARVLGHDVERHDGRVRRVIGLASPDERSFYWRLSGRRNLQFWGSLHDLRGRELTLRIEELAERLELKEFLDRRFDSYSSGMKQKMAIARGMLGAPRVLFLDEPTRSLDPAAARDLRSLIQTLVKETGLTAILVTHQLDECRELADRYGLMEEGRLTVYRMSEQDPRELFQ